MKKFISILLCICFCLSLTACGAKDEKSETIEPISSVDNVTFKETEAITSQVETSSDTSNATAITEIETEIQSYRNDSEMQQKIKASLAREKSRLSGNTAVLTFTGDCTLGYLS